MMRGVARFIRRKKTWPQKPECHIWSIPRWVITADSLELVSLFNLRLSLRKSRWFFHTNSVDDCTARKQNSYQTRGLFVTSVASWKGCTETITEWCSDDLFVKVTSTRALFLTKSNGIFSGFQKMTAKIYLWQAHIYDNVLTPFVRQDNLYIFAQFYYN